MLYDVTRPIEDEQRCIIQIVGNSLIITLYKSKRYVKGEAIMDNFKEKVSIVTGAASGIGRALGEALAQKGAIVVLADINTEGVQEVASTLTNAGGQATPVHLDVSKAEDVTNLVNRIADEHGRIDYIFNNAGIAIGGEVRDMNLEHWQKVIDVNLMGVIYGTIVAYSLMVSQGFGHIVNIASLAGLIGYPTNTPYAATKFAVVGLSTSLRNEGAELGVNVSVVCPGYVETGIYDASPILKADREKVMEKIPFKMMDVRKAAQLILKGVIRNKAIITFPFHAGLLWRLHRIHPALLTSMGRKTVSVFRELRTED
jgi:NAD(P)-dependent dehydrogenase (short-subunit alcohol dehydrogenase family)